MTISSDNRKAGPYEGDGISTEFPFEFKVFSAADLLVIRTDQFGAESTLAGDGSDYTVTLNANQNTSPGGVIVLQTELEDDFLLTITSEIGNLQPTDLTNQGGFYPAVITTALDRLTILIQQLAEKVSRSVKTSISSSISPDDLMNELASWNSQAQSAAQAAQGSSNTAQAAADAAIEAAESFGFPLPDDHALVKNSADTTRRIRISADQISPETERVITVPDKDFIMAGTNLGQIFTKPQTADVLALVDLNAWDASDKQHLTANVNGGIFTVANPTDIRPNTYYALYVTYATAHGLAFGSAFRGVSGVTPTASAGAHDHFIFRANSAGTQLELVAAAYDVGAA